MKMPLRFNWRYAKSGQAFSVGRVQMLKIKKSLAAMLPGIFYDYNFRSLKSVPET